jgi:hypothetical protein
MISAQRKRDPYWRGRQTSGEIKMTKEMRMNK